MLVSRPSFLRLGLRNRRRMVDVDATRSADRTRLADALRDSQAPARSVDEVMTGSPIHLALNRQETYNSQWIHVHYECPDEFEALATRLWQRDVAKGCYDPDLIGQARDEAIIEFVAAVDHQTDLADSSSGPAAVTLRMPCLLTHLANPCALFDPDAHETVLEPLWDDGTWTGTLVWDSAIHCFEVLLASDAWRAALVDASVLELGCG